MESYEITEITTATLSSIGCFLMMMSYCMFPQLQVFSGHVSIFLAVAGLGTAMCLYMGSPGEGTILCKAQGFGFIYFANVTIATATYISWAFHHIFVGNQRTHAKLYISSRVVLSIWILPLILASLPLVFNSYNVHADVHICWIHSSGSSEKVSLTLQLICFYAPLGMQMLFNVRTFFLLFRRVMGTTNIHSNSSTMIRQALSQVVWYPAIVFVSYIFLVVIKISAGVGFQGSWAKKLMVLSGCHGLLFSLVYLSLPAVRHQWKSLFAKVWCCAYVNASNRISEYSITSNSPITTLVDPLIQKGSKCTRPVEINFAEDINADIDAEECDDDCVLDAAEDGRESSDDNQMHPYGYSYSVDGSQRRTLSHDSSLDSLVMSQMGVNVPRDSVMSALEADESLIV